MKKLLICSIFVGLSLICTAQPPLPDTHGGWKDRTSPSSPAVTYYYYDNNSGTFRPLSDSAPIGSGTAILLSLVGGYAGVKLVRKARTRKQE